MTVNFVCLFEILKKEYKLYQALYRLAQEKQDIIIANELIELEEIVRNEESLLEEIQDLETERLQITDHNVKELLALFAENQQEQITELCSQIIELAVKLKDQNSLNNILLNDSINLLNINLNLLKDNNSTNIYNKKGLLKQQAQAYVNRRA